MADVKTAGRPELSNHTIHDILCRLPTKPVVGLSFLSKQWEGILSCLPTLDFDEGNGDDYKLEQHHRFVNMLQRCLLACNNENEEKPVSLDRFRLRMTSYLLKDAVAVTRWLSYSFKRSVREVDLSLKVSRSQRRSRRDPSWLRNYCYCLSRNNFVNAKSLTCLNLEFVRVGLKNTHTSSEPLLPSLKKMFVKNVRFDSKALSYLLEECPAVQHLSLIKSFFAGIDVINVWNCSSLKSLEIKHCKACMVNVKNAVNLESVTIVSPKPQPLVSVILRECFSLKCIRIHAWRMDMLSLEGCHDVKGTIDAPNLVHLKFKGYLKSKLSLRAPELRFAYIVLQDIFGEESSGSFDQQPWKHFPKLAEFLKEFSHISCMNLSVRDFRALIFPEDFRKTLSSAILPGLNLLMLDDTVVPANARDREDLMQSLQWMAPSAIDIHFR